MKKLFKILGIAIAILIVCILASGLILMRAGFRNVEYTPYDLPAQTPTTWTEVFAHPAPISVIQFKTGEMRLDRYPDNPPNAQDRQKPIDVLVYAIRHERYGDMLIDTGFDRSFSDTPPFGNYPFIMHIFLTLMGNNKISQERGHDLATLLASQNIAPRQVFLTHLHADHTAGIPALSQEIQYVFDARELNFMGKATLNYTNCGKYDHKFP